MANAGSKGITRYEETFAVDTIGSAGNGVAWLETNDAGTAFVRAVAAGKGLHVAGATSTGGANRHEFLSDSFMFTGQEGHSSVEILLQLGAVTDVSFNFGVFDAVTGANNILPASLSGTTITGQATDGFLGIIYDSNADNDELHVSWENGGVQTTTAIADLRMVGMAPTASKWLFMKVEMQDRGSGKGVRATFLAVDHNGRSVEKVFNTSVDRDLPLNYYLGVINRTTTAVNIYFKGVAWEQTIADM